MIRYNSISEALYKSGEILNDFGKEVPQNNWQDVKTSIPMIESFRNSFLVPMIDDKQELKIQCFAHDWAELHFQERINGNLYGKDLNPGNSYKQWPFYVNAKREDENHKDNGLFSHTYMERFWPSNAVDKIKGIRYEYGNLLDIVLLLSNDRNTRKAFLPIFFPEDTGKQNIRIPCTIGYLFNIRDNKLHLTYYIRSCDFIRHFNHDIYLSIRLAQEILKGLNDDSLSLGELWFNCESLHIFKNDLLYFKKLLLKYEEQSYNY